MALQGIRSSKSGKTIVDLSFKSDNGIVIGLESIQDRARINLYNYMLSKADEVQDYMKSHHVWQNRTGRAERGLNTKVKEDISGNKSSVQMILAHGEDVWYSVHLEYGMGRRFAIIEPTVKYYGPKLLDSLNMSELYRFVKNVRS